MAVQFRRDFISHFNNFKQALSLDPVSTVSLPSNGSSKLLRNGLAVVGFTALEDFIKNRFSVAFEEIAQTRVTFDELPEKIQKAVTYEAVSSIEHQISIRKHLEHSDKLDFIQSEAEKIASTSNERGFKLTGYAFGFGKSNVSGTDVKEALNCFHVKNPWEVMTSIAQVIGLVSLPLSNSYQNASNRRHKAAHVAQADTPYSDLENYVGEAISIAISIDIVVGRCVSKISQIDQDYLSGDRSKRLGEEDFPFYLVKKVRGHWKAYLSSNLDRAKATGREKSEVVTRAEVLATGLDAALVVFDESGDVEDWYFP
ncbi:hypothetical protein SAMN05216571_104349 [Onishia taeanensis]|uniref:RiboL-PSP-HEPN domain-containing protein n=1 Tax=Onishia taeanensis TaxID=284577 RepID=A0A1G7RM14_9GAMM|nr:HEPN domain-containing protein [Halomonas taeanensis]SDG11811.1 hypothetical protein SAMN05216571_104349 [Halomonas taeanensis]